MSAHKIVWIASYPKSGNTWVRAFLANYFLGEAEGLKPSEWSNFVISDVNDALYRTVAGGTLQIEELEAYLKLRDRALRALHDSQPGHRFVKTHHRSASIKGHALIPPPLTAAAIYLIRNPFDLAPSFARHRNAGIDEVINLMCAEDGHARNDDGLYEIYGRWDRHVEDWTSAEGLSRLTLRYEDMRAAPKPNFQKLLDFLQVKPDPPQFRRAIKATRLETLRKQEAQGEFKERPQHLDHFFHKGSVGGWRDTLSPDQIVRLYEAFETTLQAWYPEIAADAAEIAGGMGA